MSCLLLLDGWTVRRIMAPLCFSVYLKIKHFRYLQCNGSLFKASHFIWRPSLKLPSVSISLNWKTTKLFPSTINFHIWNHHEIHISIYWITMKFINSIYFRFLQLMSTRRKQIPTSFMAVSVGCNQMSSHQSIYATTKESITYRLRNIIPFTIC